MYKNILYIMTLILLASFVSAYTQYYETGFNNYFDDGVARVQTDADFTGIRSLNNPKSMPYIADLDNDGTNEIIVIDGENIRLYNQETLTIVDTYSTGDENITEIHIYDIDHDNLLDMIYFSCTETNIHFLEYNSSGFSDIVLDVGTVIGFGCNSDIGFGHHIECNSEDYCLLETISSNANPTFTAFNKTAKSTTAKEENVINQACLPYIKKFFYGDVDGAGGSEWVASAIVMNNLGDDNQEILVNYVTVDSVTLDVTITESFYYDVGNDFDSDICREQFNMVAVTSPTVFNFDGSTSNGFEVLIGSIVSQSGTNVESKFYVFEGDGGILTTYPTGTAEGYPTNIVRTNLFDSSGIVDACLMLHAETDSEQSLNPSVTMLCGSESASEVIHHREFVYTLSDVLQRPPKHYNGVMHSLDANFQVIEGEDALEMITPFGIFTPNLNRCNPITAYCELTFDDLIQEFETASISPFNLAVTPISIVGLTNDFLVMSNSTLYYFDDGLSKSDCSQQSCIQDVQFNPNICDNTAQLNTTLGILIEVEEVDNDMVICQAVAYEGEGLDEILTPPENVTGGSGTIVLDLVLNKTTTYSTIAVYCYETDEPTEVDIIRQVYSVADEGDQFGESSCDLEIITEVPDEDDEVLQEGDVGTVCDSGEDCNSGFCQRGICALKGFRVECSLNAQCLSGVCLNGACTKPSLMQNLDASKTEQFGNDSDTNNVLSLIIIVGVAIVVIISGAGHIWAVVVALVLSYGLAFLLTLIGWLSPFILMGFIIVALLGVVLMVIIRGGSD